jgi:AcrR family transcriptional regulator
VVNGVDTRVDQPDNPAVPGPTRIRPELSRDLILDAAEAIIEREGESALTFRHLGAWLGADPTAAYRHFRSKDDLLLALGDRLVGEAMDAVPPDLAWRDTLREMALALRRTLLLHPRLAVLIAVRTTQGEQEARGIERILAVLAGAGLSTGDAVATWRALGDTTLAWAGFGAAYLALPDEIRLRDQAAWTTYRALPADRYPHIAAARPYLDDIDDAFPAALELLLDGVAVRVSATPA